MAVLKSEIKRFHRFHGYDYSRGAVLFITFGLKKRLPVFGWVEGYKVVYNRVGEAAIETMQREMKRNANLVVHRFVIMPDHVHLRIYIRPNTKDPLVQVGRFVHARSASRPATSSQRKGMAEAKARKTPRRTASRTCSGSSCPPRSARR